MELIFEIRDTEEGGYWARALGYAIFTEGETWEELRGNILEAISVHFEDAPTRPRLVQMHYVKDELIPWKPRETSARCAGRSADSRTRAFGLQDRPLKGQPYEAAA